MELKGFSFHHIVPHKACGAGKPATVLVLETWKVSDKSPRRIQLLSLHFCFVFQSTLKRNQWTYKCADTTSYIVPLGLDTGAAMKQLCAGMASWHWHANKQSQWNIFQSLWRPVFFFFFYRFYLLLQAFIGPQNNLNVFLLQLLHFFPSRLRALVCVCLYIHIDVYKFSLL